MIIYVWINGGINDEKKTYSFMYYGCVWYF